MIEGLAGFPTGEIFRHPPGRYISFIFDYDWIAGKFGQVSLRFNWSPDKLTDFNPTTKRISSWTIVSPRWTRRRQFFSSPRSKRVLKKFSSFSARTFMNLVPFSGYFFSVFLYQVHYCRKVKLRYWSDNSDYWWITLLKNIFAIEDLIFIKFVHLIVLFRSFFMNEMGPDYKKNSNSKSNKCCVNASPVKEYGYN